MKRWMIAAVAAVLAVAGCGGRVQDGPPVPSEEKFEHLDLGHGTAKKGLCVSRYDDGSDMGAANLNSLGISWYYNWGAELPTDKINAEYVPMIWGAGSVNERTLSHIAEGVKNGTYTHVLTFNEPDAATPGISSGVSVETALDLWPQLEALDVPLSSPAPTYYGTGWLDEFMEGAQERGYRVDFIALHCYQNFADPNAVEELEAELTEVYAKYELPIWITEFAAIDIWAWGGGKNPACTEEAALLYTQKVTDMLENLGFVERYAWFIDNTGSPAEARAEEAKYTYLFDNDGGITGTGEVYRDVPSRIPLYLTSSMLPVGKAGQDYDFQLVAAGGRGDYSFSVREGDLPQGLALGRSGQLCGRTAETGYFPVRVYVTDDDGQRTFRDFFLIIDP